VSTIYYRGPLALITEDWFEVRVPQRRRFPIKELSNVHEERSGEPLALRGVGAAGATAAAVAVSLPFLDPPVFWFGTVAVLVAPCAIGGACWRMNRADLELWATCGGLRIRLFTSRDARAFGQVKRALLRALEHAAEEQET
jgi:hypothetical protein